jgi:hypothetical protein
MPTNDVTRQIDLHAVVVHTMGICASIVSEARNTDNPRLALTAAQRVAQLAELAARLRGDLNDRAQVSIHLAPEFAQLQQQLLAILEPHPELRAQVARTLLAASNDGR